MGAAVAKRAGSTIWKNDLNEPGEGKEIEGNESVFFSMKMCACFAWKRIGGEKPNETRIQTAAEAHSSFNYFPQLLSYAD